jgi:hypothetical protein
MKERTNSSYSYRLENSHFPERMRPLPISGRVLAFNLLVTSLFNIVFIFVFPPSVPNAPSATEWPFPVIAQGPSRCAAYNLLRDRDVALVEVCPRFQIQLLTVASTFSLQLQKKGLTIDYRFPLRKRHLTHPILEFISNQ